MKENLVIGFEGPCLSGKTTVIQILEKALSNAEWPVLCVAEYNKYAGGFKNMPGVIPADSLSALRAAEFLLELEAQRRRDIVKWASGLRGKVGIILIDRLLLSCMIVQHRVNDIAGYRRMLQAVRDNQMIIPDITFFLRICVDQAEYHRRLDQRIPFKDSGIVYEANGYEDYFRDFDQNIAGLNPVYCDSSQTDFMIDMLLSRVERRGNEQVK